MYELCEALVNKNFTVHFCEQICKNVKIGILAFQQLVINNKDFFSFKKGKFLHGHMLTYAVESSIYSSSLSPSALFSAFLGELNGYGYNGLYLRTDDFILNVSRTRKVHRLPQKAKYREKLAACNEGTDAQMYIDVPSGIIKYDDYRYAIITYGYSNDDLSHLAILVPNSKYNGYNFFINALKANDTTQDFPTEEAEEQLVALNKDLQLKLERMAGDTN